MSPAHRVVCAGHVNWDVTMRVDRLPDPDGEASIEFERGAGGGSAANVAVGLDGLGVSATLLGSVGDDERGRRAREELTAAGVDCDHVVTVTDRPTATKYLVVDAGGDVFVLGRDGANEAFTADDLPDETLADAAWLHLTSQNPETAAALAERARDAGVTVSFDPGRRAAERPYGPTLAAVDVAFCNDREASAVLDHVSESATVVVKHGRWGAEVRTPEETVEHGGFEVDTVDTTGAGDAFAAGYVAASLDGEDVATALATANACGALAAGQLGARVGLDWATVRALVRGEGSVDG